MKGSWKNTTFIAAALMLTGIWAAPAGAGNTWLDANGLRTDNVTLNGSAVTNATYWIDPPFLSSKVPPNVLFVLDNSLSMNDQAYASTYDPTQFVTGKYYGYFDSTKCYKFQSSKWDVVGDVNASTGCQAFSASATTTNPVASGNLLNWATMRRIDAAKKLLVGGKANPRSMTAGCCVKLNGEASSSSWNFSKDFDTTSTGLIYPFEGNYRYSMSGAALSMTPRFTATDPTIRPNANVSAPAAWTVTGATSAWDAVDETTSGGDTSTYIQNKTNTTSVIFNYADAYTAGSPPSGVITDITVYVVAKKSSSSTMRLRAVVRAGGTDYDSNYSNLSTSYATYNFTWTLNPKTNVAWIWDDIKPGTSTDGLQGFGVRAETTPSSSLYPTVTQVYIIINVTAPTGGPYGITIDTGNSKVSGIVDDLSSDARFGLAYYNDDGQGFESCSNICGSSTSCKNTCNTCVSSCGSNQTCIKNCYDASGASYTGKYDGGHIDTYVDFGTPTNMITSIGNLTPSTYTPLSETLYEMVRYFRQDAPYYSGNSPADYSVGANTYRDPYYYMYSNVTGSALLDQYVPCAKSFILLLTDGEPTYDLNIPSTYRDYDADGRDTGSNPSYNLSGSDYLDDVAYWARTTDARSTIAGNQNIILYSVFMFGKGSKLLMDAAINGGFDDTDGNNVPGCTHPATAGSPTQNELKECYRDSNGNGTIDPYDVTTNPDGDLPLTYYQGDDGYELQSSIVDAITAILRRSASGTSVSVLGSSWKGEGSIFQAYFYPEKVEDLRRIKWTGYFQSLFVDRFGLIHEDTNQDGVLKASDDRVVKFVFTSGNDTRVEFYWDKVDNTTGASNPDGQLDSVTPIETLTIGGLNPLWDAGKLLAYRTPPDRKIYTSVDNANLIDFNYDSSTGTDNSKLLRPYLRAKTDAGDSGTHSLNATSLIKFVRGEEVTGWRDRQLTVDGALRTWKLGDIVFSDPLVIPAPKERFDRIYGSESYKNYYNYWKNRRAVVYVGGNDGMLHAFNNGFSESAPADATITSTMAQLTVHTGVTLDPVTREVVSYSTDATKPLGKELWAFVPYDVLPHLAWLGDPDYQHVYYVDLMTRATDADIFTPDADHVEGWGTVIIIGLRLGGGEIDVQDDFGSGTVTKKAFKSAYYALDITNPEAPPKLLWRFTDDELGFTLGTPTIVKESDKWYAVFGSGPSNFRGGRVVDTTITNTKFTKNGQVAGLNGMSSTSPYLYVIDLKTGQPTSTWTEHTSVSGSGKKGFIKLSSTETNGFAAGATATDFPLDFNYDMIYVGTNYCATSCNADGSPTSTGSWSGNMYRINMRDTSVTPQAHLTDPGLWTVSKVFSPGRPITTKPSIGADPSSNVWVYFGTGRFLHIDDRFDASQQTFYGFKDTCHGSGCSTTMTSTYFLNSNNYTVDSTVGTPTSGNMVPAIPAYTMGPLQTSALPTFKQLENFMRDSGTGWYVTLGTRERITVNGFVVAGIAGFGSYTPNDDVCEFEGTSKEYFPYYLTGTVYYSPQGTPMTSVFESTGSGLPSAPAIHIDSKGEAKLFIQKSTGEIKVIKLPTATPVTGGLGGGGECPQ